MAIPPKPDWKPDWTLDNARRVLDGSIAELRAVAETLHRLGAACQDRPLQADEPEYWGKWLKLAMVMAGMHLELLTEFLGKTLRTPPLGPPPGEPARQPRTRSEITANAQAAAGGIALQLLLIRDAVRRLAEAVATLAETTANGGSAGEREVADWLKICGEDHLPAAIQSLRFAAWGPFDDQGGAINPDG